MTSCYWLAPEGTRDDDVATCRTVDKQARIAWVSFATTIGRCSLQITSLDHALELKSPLNLPHYVYIGWFRNVTVPVNHWRNYALVGDSYITDIQLPDQTEGQ